MNGAFDALSRRDLLAAAGAALGGRLVPAAGGEASRGPHFAPRARAIIQLFMAGAPSSLDLFDDKPMLRRHDGQPVPEQLLAGQRFAFLKGRPDLLASPFSFARHGDSGAEISELLPHTASIADRLAIVKSVQTNHFNHGPAQVFANTGHIIVGRPSLGSWLLHGLGAETHDLPGFVVMVSGKIDPGAGSACWSSGFLPTTLQGVELRSRGEMVPCVADPPSFDRPARRRGIDLLADLNRLRAEVLGDPEIEARTAAYQLAFRMQQSVPELALLRAEPEHVHRLYGSDPGHGSFANNCLMARRLVERGVRCVQVIHRGWDHHGTDDSDDLLHGLPNMCRQTDRAVAALVLDLEQRGLLDDTLVVWGGEFGRTAMREVRNEAHLGRDHNPRAFTMWFAGGGVRPGITFGATDELGYDVVEDPVHLHDVHATVLHLLGIDHERLTFRFQGRDYRLTDVSGRVVPQLLA
ncbi:MAG TPA: DUF1501 domain-containing protein [Planctomycetota bacterium]|nr:DUF1501 domain-containing protein [Planctomycetota bacterium]